ncbi:MAG: acyl-CoA-binding protein [Cyclobacteriaceae bacterium]
MAINFEDYSNIEKCQLEGEALDKEFERILPVARGMDTQTSDDMLVAYAYYKQATVGDSRPDQAPKLMDIVKTFKFNTWRRLNGMSKEEAKRSYIDYINYLLQK